MESIRKQAINIVQDSNIDFLIKKLETYSMKDSVGISSNNGDKLQLRQDLIFFINKTIGYSHSDLTEFINHFS